MTSIQKAQTKTKVIMFRCSPDLKAELEEAGKRSMLGLSAYIRAVLARAVTERAFLPREGDEEATHRGRADSP